MNISILPGTCALFISALHFCKGDTCVTIEKMLKYLRIECLFLDIVFPNPPGHADKLNTN